MLLRNHWLELRQTPTGFDRQTLDSIANKRSWHKGDCLSMQPLQGDYLRILDGTGRMPCDHRRSRLVLTDSLAVAWLNFRPGAVFTADSPGHIARFRSSLHLEVQRLFRPAAPRHRMLHWPRPS